MVNLTLILLLCQRKMKQINFEENFRIYLQLTNQTSDKIKEMCIVIC